MPTFTIDLPDTLNVPSNWDIQAFVQAFVVTKMHEAGYLLPDQESVQEYIPMEEDPDCWFTPEQIAQAKENRRRLEEKWAKNPPPLSREEFRQALLNCPVATEEEIQALEEIQEMRKRSERDDFLLNYTIRKDCERRRAERDELQKKASAYGNNEKPETAPSPAVKGSRCVN